MTEAQPGEWWATITHAFESHLREEAHFLDDYEELCEEVSDPGARFLIELILADERRHHDLFEQLAAAARGADGGTPGPPRLPADEAARLLAPTERFLEAELEDREHLKELRKQLRPARDDTLWRLIIELMDLDTAKHVKILEFLSGHLRRAASTSG